MRRFNSLRTTDEHERSNKDAVVQPLVYATYQAYLKRYFDASEFTSQIIQMPSFFFFRTPEQLRRSLIDAEHGGYSLGVKLVRGAYHHFEIDAAPSPDLAPVWSNKSQTDACYDACAATLISALREDVDNRSEPPRLAILFGTHNSNSCAKILDALGREGLAYTKNGILNLSSMATERCTIGQLFGEISSLLPFP
jgi:proline dehydrogenase